MPQSLYVAAIEPGSGKSLVTLGLAEFLTRRVEQLRFFRPIIAGLEKEDNDTELIRRRYSPKASYESLYAATHAEAQELYLSDRYDDLIKRIVVRYESLKEESDFILCEGTDFIKESSAFEFGINVQVVKNLGIPVLIMGRGDLDRSPLETLAPIKLAIETFHAQEYDVMGVIVNRADPEKRESILEAMEDYLPGRNIFGAVIPSVQFPFGSL